MQSKETDTEALSVGSMVYLPNRLTPDHPAHRLAARIFGNPGPIVSIEDGHAMVDLGSWGQFGCPVADLRPAEPPQDQETAPDAA